MEIVDQLDVTSLFHSHISKRIKVIIMFITKALVMVFEYWLLANALEMYQHHLLMKQSVDR